MKEFISFVVKEVYHIVRDFKTLLVLFGMPIVQILLFGFAITNDIKDVKIGIYDQSKDCITEEIREKILSSGYFKLVTNLNTVGEIEEQFKAGTIKEVIIFPVNLGKELEGNSNPGIQLIIDASEPNLANIILGYSSSIIDDYLKQKFPAKLPAPYIEPKISLRYNPELKSVFMYVPGLISVILLLITALMTSISITREKEVGTMEILLVSPLHPFQIIIGKVIPYLFLSLVDMTIILLLAKYVFLIPIKGSLMLLIFESLIFVLTALSLGILISTISPNQQTALMASLGGLILPTVILSGYLFPIESMPQILQYISTIIPARWFVFILRGIMLKGNTLQDLYWETLILIGMCLLFLVVSIKKFKARLD
ncbi:MAG: ABC transporter permease [Ignavibacteria bacterium]